MVVGNKLSFRETMRMCTEDVRLVRRIESAEQTVYPEGSTIPKRSHRLYSDDASVRVTDNRTLQAAKAYRGKNVCVLNFANAHKPGGGVEYGANAQEEALCRICTLYPLISCDSALKEFYMPHNNLGPLGNDDLIITKGVTVFKTDDAYMEIMDESEWYDVTVITCAAPELYGGAIFDDGLITSGALEELHYKRASRIMEAACSVGAEVLVLGAFGCGAFCNPSGIVAKGFSRALNDFKSSFEIVEFAIFGSDYNRERFKDALSKSFLHSR